ncbi:Aminopeptidase N [Frondihabitans sp. 762G35]|uniref:M1 family metallopeptidase n=1 Tax=Frondihabitans sp. 762G35 TaxID=1446794 RepID=UPI000D20DD39|nr:M1 family metallopeptidase [Frondihabitans sp. 762G35]ARC56213.1 Aminopeptidase N [Frondihabitans sp. 762G35]
MIRRDAETPTRIHRSRRALGLLLAAGAIAAPLSAVAVPATAASAAAAPIAGATSAGDSLFAGIGNGGYDVTHYGVDLAYATDGSIAATTTISATATTALSSFSLDFEGLTVTSVVVNGQAATFVREQDPAISKYKLVVTPQTPVDGDFTAVISYAGTPVQHTDPDGSSEGWSTTSDGATAVGQPVGTMTWLPSDNTPRDKATFDIALTVPTLLGGTSAAGVSNGVLTAQTPHADGTTTWAWKQSKPMATELALVSIGRYTEFQSTIPLQGGRSIPERSFVDPSTSPQALAEITSLRAELPEIFAFLEKKYGRYPGDATGVVVDNTDLGYALETQDRPFFEGSIDRETLVHELTHQWFGDAVTPADWGDIWLNEGPATYTPLVYDEEHGGPTAEDSLYDLWNSTPAGAPEWTIPPAKMTDAADLFGWQVYNRGAMTLEALRSAVTTPVFEEIMRRWYAERVGTSISTADFIALAEKVSGRSLGAFFQDWLYDADKPAWPATWTLALATPRAKASAVPAGSDLGYVVTATATGKVPLRGATVEVDLEALLATATLDPGSLPAGARLDGTTLLWTVPTTATGASATLPFTVHLDDPRRASLVDVGARAVTLGATCAGCTVSHTLVAAAVGTVEPAAAQPTLAATGTDAATPAAGALALVALGGLLLASGRRRRTVNVGAGATASRPESPRRR